VTAHREELLLRNPLGELLHAPRVVGNEAVGADKAGPPTGGTQGVRLGQQARILVLGKIERVPLNMAKRWTSRRGTVGVAM
jgi:hypothetical protein